MALVTPLGLLADWTLTLTSVSGDVISGNIVGDNLIELPNGQTLCVQRYRWRPVGDSASTRKPLFADEDSTIWDDWDANVAEMAGSSFYVWDGDNVNEAPVSDRIAVNDDSMDWNLFSRPVSIIVGSAIRYIYADAGQATVVSNFVQGLETPDAAFTSSVNNLTVAFTDTSTGGTPTSWLWDFGDGNSSTDQNPSHTYASAGTRTVTLTATNSVGSTMASASVTALAPPDLTPSAPTVPDQNATAGSPFSVTLAVGTGGDPPLSYAVSGRPAWLAFNTTSRVLSGTPTAAGTHTLRYVVTDDDGDSDTDEFTLTVRAAPATFTLQSLTTGTNEDARFLVVVETQTGSEDFWYGDDEGIGTLTGDADLPPLIDRVRMRTVGRGLEFNRDTGGDFNTYWNANAGKSLFVALNNAGAEELLEFPSADVDSAAANMRITRATLTAIEEAILDAQQHGDTVLFVIADTGSVGLTSDDLMPTAPSIADQTGQVNVAFSVTLPVGTGGDPPLTYSASGLPSWATFVPATRVLSGTPDAVATSTITYTVTDDDGDTDDTTFDIVIPDLMPTLPAVSDQTLDWGSALSVTLPEATGGDGTLSYSVSGLPSWATFTASTRALTGTASGLATTTTVTYTVTDADGDTDTADFDITVDAVVPPANTQIMATPGETTIALTWMQNGNGGAALNRQRVRYTPDGGSRMTVDVTNGATSHTLTGLVSETEYTIDVQLRNSVGIRNSQSITATTTAADLMPTAPTVANQSGEVNTAFTVTLPVGTGGDAPLSYAVSGQPSWATFTAATRVLAGTPDAAATTTVTYTVTDNDGDTDSTTFTITIAPEDLTPAAPTIADQSGKVGTAFSVTLPVGTGGDAPLTYSVSGEPSWASFVPATRVLSGTPDAAGTTTVTYTVTDDDGDSDDTTFDIAVAADLMPAAPTVADQSGQVNVAFSVTLPVGTGGDAPLAYSLSGQPSWASFNTTSRVLSGTPDAAGTTTLTYTVTDADGDSDDTTFDIVIAAADLMPALPAVADQSGVVGTAFSVTLPTATGGNPPIIYAVSGRPAWLAFNATSRVLSGTPTATGTSTLTYTATDDDGDAATRNFDLVISAADLMPTAPAVADQSATNGVAFSVTLPVGTGGDPPLTYSTSGLPSWASFNTTTRVLSGTPDATGTSAVTYTVTDSDGDTDDATFDIVVSAADLMPTAPSVADQSATVGTAFSATLPVGTGGDAPLSYSVSGEPSWATFVPATRVLSGTPDAVAVTTVTYTVTDVDGDTDSTTFTITVTAADLMPTLPVVADQAGQTGVAFTLTLPAATSGDLPITYAVSGRPGWLAFNATTRVLSGTPTTAATSTLTYTATDDDGDAATRMFDIVVTATLPPAPVAAFTHVVSDLAVQFTDTSTNTPTTWAWAFGDGGTSTQQNPSHTYASAGTRTVTLTATNAGGSDTFSAQVTATAADLMPTLASVNDQTLDWGAALSVTLPAGTGGDGVLTYTLTGLPSWASFNATSRVLSGTASGIAATSALTYTVEDSDGDMASQDFDLTVDAIAPPLVTNIVATPGEDEIALVWQQNGNGGALITQQRIRYKVAGSPARFMVVDNDATSATLTGLDAETEHAIRIRLVNSAGRSDTSDITASTTAADLTPVLAVVADQVATVGTAFTLTLPAATSGNPPVTYAVSGRPAWLAFNATTRVLSGTPTAAGTSALTYTATDDDGDVASRSFDLVASVALPDAPVAAFTHVVTDLTVQFTDTSTNTPTSWAWTFGDGATSTAQNPSRTYASAGTRTVTLTATNAGGSDAFSAQVTTIAVDLTPTLPAVADQNANVDSDFSLRLPQATGGDPPLTYTLTGRPAWLAFNAGTRVASGTPDAIGTTTLTYRVADDDGDTDTLTFDIAVAAALTGPQIISDAYEDSFSNQVDDRYSLAIELVDRAGVVIGDAGIESASISEILDQPGTISCTLPASFAELVDEATSFRLRDSQGQVITEGYLTDLSFSRLPGSESFQISAFDSLILLQRVNTLPSAYESETLTTAGELIESLCRLAGWDARPVNPVHFSPAVDLAGIGALAGISDICEVERHALPSGSWLTPSGLWRARRGSRKPAAGRVVIRAKGSQPKRNCQLDRAPGR